MKLLTALLIGSALFLPACSDEAASSSSTTLPPCEHHAQDGQQDPGYKTWDCKLASPCEQAQFFGPGTYMLEDNPPPPHFKDVEVAKCALTALRDRAQASVSYWRQDDPIGQIITMETIFLVGGDKAVANWSKTIDIGFEGRVTNRARLKPASYFDGCLAMTDESAMYDCLASWSDGCIEEAVTCP